MKLVNLFLTGLTFVVLIAILGACSSYDPCFPNNNSDVILVDHSQESVIALYDESQTEDYPKICEYVVSGNQTFVDFEVRKRFTYEYEEDLSIDDIRFNVSVHRQCGCSFDDKNKSCDSNAVDVVPYQKTNNTYSFENGLNITPYIENGALRLKVLVPENRKQTESIMSINVKYDIKNSDNKIYATAKIYQLPVFDTNNLTIQYKGTRYNSMVAPLDCPVYKNKETSDMIKNLEGRRDLISILKDKIIYIFDNEDVKSIDWVKDIIKIGKLNANISLATQNDMEETGYAMMTPDAVGYFALFENNNYVGGALHHNSINSGNCLLNKKISDSSLSKSVSSLALSYNGNDSDFCSVLRIASEGSTVNNENDFDGQFMFFVATKENPRIEISYLNALPCIGSSRGWKNNIETINFYFSPYCR